MVMSLKRGFPCRRKLPDVALQALFSLFALFSILTFGMSRADASIPLSEQKLARGKSRYLARPDYTFKLLEALSFNSGYNGGELSFLRDRISSCGLLEMTSDELYQLDRKAREILDPIFAKILPEEMREYNLVFLDGTKTIAQVIPGVKSVAVPTILVDRQILNDVAYRDKFAGVVAHETYHVMHARRSRDRDFDRAFKQSLEENAADDKAVDALVDVGLNPLGFSLIMEELLHIGSERRSNSFSREGFISHPPTETRLTRINARIERASERRSFPDLTPIPPLFTAIAGLPPAHSASARLYSALGESVYELVSNLSRMSYSESGEEFENPDVALKRLSEQFDVVRARIRPETFAAWGGARAWSNVPKALMDIWGSLPVAFKADRRFQELFLREQEKWRELSTLFGQPFTAEDSAQVRHFQTIAGIRDSASLLAWSETLPLAGEFDSRRERLEYLSRHLSYSLYRDPSLFTAAFDNYIQLAPFLSDRVEKALTHPDSPESRQELEAIARLRDFMLNHLPAWTISRTGTPYYRELRAEARRREPDRNWRMSDYLPEDLLLKALDHMSGKWNEAIERLPIPDYAKLAFFAPVRAEPFLWDWSLDRSYDKDFRGVPLFSASLGFLLDMEVQGRAFARFRHGLQFLRALNPQGRKNLVFPRDYGHLNSSGMLGVEDRLDWTYQAVSRLDLTADDALYVLADDSFWEVNEPRTKGEIRAKVRRFTENLMWTAALYIGPPSFWERFGIRREADKAVSDTFDEAEFYSRPEYQLTPRKNERVQLAAYTNLKKNGALPSRFADEVDLWFRFAKRGVTGFTDDWANSLISRFEVDYGYKQAGRANNDSSARTASRPVAGTENLAAIQRMYTSNLVWELPVRERLALIVLDPRTSPELKSLREQAGSAQKNSRWKEIEAVLRQLRHEFPESSQERLSVADRIAERIRASAEETGRIMKYVGREQQTFANPDSGRGENLSRKEALGVRFYSQLFGEVQRYSLDERLELLDYFLGRTDHVPYLLRADSRRENEQRNEPLLYELRRSHIRPSRLRQAFHTVSVEARTVIIDPLVLGPSGILENDKGREWIINTLVPKGVPWRQMAVDLVDGYRQALQKFGQGHLKTMFISYLLASAVQTGSGAYDEIFPAPAGENADETLEGRILRAVFGANSALNKIGQRLHSSNVLPLNINKSLVSLKENSTRILREDQFAWIANASRCGVKEERDSDECLGNDFIHLFGEIGNASTKVVLDAEVDGKDAVLYLIKPNAFLRGDTFFKMLEYAVDYAIGKGHDQLRVFRPMLQRARKTFARETDLRFEREATLKLRDVYKPGKIYGKGFQFITVDFLDTDHLLKPELAAAVTKVKVQRFSDLTEAEQSEATIAITAKEAEIHARSNGEVVFDKDRHEGNYLFVTDPELLAKYGVEEGKLILVIDVTQIAQMEPATRSAVHDAAAAVAALRLGSFSAEPFTEPFAERAARILAEAINGALRAPVVDPEEDASVMRLTEQLVSAEQIAAHFPQIVDENSSDLSVGEALSRLLSYIESDGFLLKDEVWDYLTIVSTMQTWDKYGSPNVFSQNLTFDVGARCMRFLSDR